MTALPAKTSISDTYPNPSNATARAGFAQLYDVIKELIETPEVEIAAATTLDIGGQASTKVRVYGLTTISSFGTNYRGPILLRFASALTITHSNSILHCPGKVNLAIRVDDVCIAWPVSWANNGIHDGWEIAILARGDGGEDFPGSVNISGLLTPSQTVGIKGTTTNNNANPGSIGEYKSDTIVGASAVPLVTDTAKTVTSLSLTAGDWDVGGDVLFVYGATTSITMIQGSVSQTNNTLDSDFRFSHPSAAFVPGTVTPMGHAVPTTRLSLSGTTTIYLVAHAIFTVSTMSAYGTIWARRRR